MKNTIIHSDCFDFLAKVPRKSVDLAVVDPPYNLKRYAWDNYGSEEQFLEFTYRWIDRLIPTIRETGALYIFNTPINCAHISVYLLRKGLHFRNWITWDKRDGFAGGRRRFTPLQESILYFSIGEDPVFNADAVRVPYDSHQRIKHAERVGILKNGKRWFPNPAGKLCTDVWHFASDRHVRKQNGKVVKSFHGTPKPEALIERIILASSNPGDCVLDCFAGSGTTPYVARRLGRHFYACDSNFEFVEYARRRLSNHES